MARRTRNPESVGWSILWQLLKAVQIGTWMLLLLLTSLSVTKTERITEGLDAYIHQHAIACGLDDVKRAKHPGGADDNAK
jgi:hypothetical protein